MPSDPTECDELAAGLTSGLWQRLCAHVEQEWGPAGQAYQQAIQRAISGPLGTEAEAVHRLKMVAYTQAEVRKLLAWPAERVAQLRQRQDMAVTSPSRRGPGL